MQLLSSSPVDLHKHMSPGKLLTKCAFNLTGDHGDMLKQGQLYVSNGNGKLYIALPVDDIIGDLNPDSSQVSRPSYVSFNSSSIGLTSNLEDSDDSLDGVSL